MARVHERLAQEKSLRLEVRMPETLPPVLADRDRVQQVLTNLISNAIKFSRTGSQITVTAEPFRGQRSGEAREWVRACVHDLGAGVSPEDQQIIFGPFRQGTRSALTDKPQGTGLGLPICKRILEHYGGNIWVESEVGQGSRFFFTLPAELPYIARPPGAG